MQFDELVLRQPGRLVQSVDVLRDDGADEAPLGPACDRPMAASRPGSGIKVVHRELSAPCLGPLRRVGHEVLEPDGLMDPPGTAW